MASIFDDMPDAPAVPAGKLASGSIFDDMPGAVAAPAAAPTAEPIAQIPGADEPYVPRAPAPRPEPVGIGEQLLGGTADAVDFIFAGVPSMAVAAAGDVVTRTQTALNSAFGLSAPKSRRDVGKAGNETAARITQSYGTPARSVLQSLGLLSERPLAIGQAMEKVSHIIDSIGSQVEAKTGGAVLKEDVLTGVNVLFGAAAGKGVKLAADKTAAGLAKMQAARDAVKKAQELQAAGELKAFNEAESIGAKLEAQKQSVTPEAMRTAAEADAQRAKAEKLAYELMRDGAPQRRVDALVKANPAIGAAMDRITERRAAAAVFAEDAAPAPLRPEVAALRRPSEMGATEFAARDAAAGVARGPLGEPVASANPQARPTPRRSIARGRPVTDSGLMGVAAKPEPDLLGAAASGGRGSGRTPSGRPATGSGVAGIPVKRDALGTPLSGPDVAAVAGATGLGLAAYFAAQGDTDEATALAMSGALLVGRGRGQGLTLEALRTAPDNAPLSALRDADLVTLNTLENLPGNRSSFSKQSVAELLKRAEVTKAERDVIQPVLDAAPGDTISAKALMTGVKERTGNFELKAKETHSFADYGLDEIGRTSTDYFDNPTPASAALGRRGIWEVFDANGDVIAEARNATDEASALAEVRAAIDSSRSVQDTATTTIWQSPVELGSSNHFHDPNYFAHSRSFVENGVRHVVELQSDLAQKAGKVLTPEERAALVAEHAKADRNHAALKAAVDATETPGELRAVLQEAGIEIADGGAVIGIAKRAVAAADLKRMELLAKLREVAPLESVSPMLKRWDKRVIREELARAAREGEGKVRFATADTVAKVESWPEPRAAVEARILENEILLEGNHRTLDRRFVQDILANDRQILENLPAGRFRPEHQGIYDRYAGDVTKFLKQLGGVEVTDSAGHTWIEVPTAGTRRMPAGPRAQQFGSADPKLMAAIAAIGGGVALGALLDEERPGRGGMLGGLAGAVLSLGLFAKSHSPGIAEMAQSVGRGAEYALGVVSTRVGQMSPAFLRRMREHERGVLTRTNAYLKEISPFVEHLRRLPQDLQDRLGAAMLTGDSAKVVATLGAAKAVGLLPEWRKARNLLDTVGRELMAAGKLKGMLPDYYPRIVIDAPGLIKALGGEQRTYVERLLKEANDKAMASAGRELSPLETSALINKALKQRPGDGRPGFLKQRSVEEVDARLLPFYAPASESLPLYLRAVGKELERARFFGDNLVRDADTGLAHIDQSIGNLVRQEWQAKRITAEQMDELGDILRSRFGPGERATARPLQAAKNIAYAGLLGHVTSALTQGGDLLISAYAHGVLPTLKALQQQVTNRQARATVADLGMIDHMAEEITGATRTPVTVLGRQLSTAKFLQTVFRYSGFSAVDQLGKNVSIQASRNKLTSWARSPAGMKKLEAKYGKAYPGEELAALVADLRSGVLTDRVKGVLFSELSDVQPISRIEVPQAYLDMPNGRVLYMLKTFMLKQMDIARRDVVGQLRAGRIAQGMKNGLRLSLALGIGGAGTSLINDWLLGRDSDADWGDVPLNALKTFGWSAYTIDKVKQGRPAEAAMDVALPPYKMLDAIIAQDPRAIQYLPVIGRLMYAHNWGDLLDESGAEKYNRKLELQRNRED